MNILITGASGFIGSRLIVAASTLYGSENIIALSSNPNLACETVIYDGADLNIQSTDIDKLKKINVIIHAGAFTPKHGSDVNNIEKSNQNIKFTENLLNLPFPNLKKVIYLSTLDVYSSDSKISEESATLPLTLYGLSKLYCERMISIFSEENDVDYQILRIGHVYGPGEEKYSKFLPLAIKNIIDEKPVELWGDGSELRSFIYIEDVVKACICSILLNEKIGPINIVGGTAISIKELLDKIIEISNKHVEVILKESNGLKRDLVFDNSKMQKYLLDRETDLNSGLLTEFKHLEKLV